MLKITQNALTSLIGYNVQRFSLERTAFFAWRRGAHVSLRGFAVGSRAGKRKTGWTKPLPRSRRLWALNAGGSPRRCAIWSIRGTEQAREGTVGAASSGNRALKRSAEPESAPLAPVRARLWSSRRKRRHRDRAGHSASCGWHADPGS